MRTSRLSLKEMAGCGMKHGIVDRWTLIPSYPSIMHDEVRIFKEIKNAIDENVGELIESLGVKVPVSADIPPYIMYLLLNNAYEHGDIELIDKYVTRGAKALVVGAGIGFTSAAIHKKTLMPVTAVDADPSLQEKIEATAKANNFNISFINGAVCPPKTSGSIDFFISEEYWASSLFEDTYKAAKKISVPIIDMVKIIEEGSHNLLFIDIEGAESRLFSHLKLPEIVKQIFVEIHRPNIGETATAKTMSDLWEQGFHCVDMHGLTSYWER